MEAELSDKHKMCKPIAINEGRLNAKGRPLNPLNPLGKFYANFTSKCHYEICIF